MKRVNHLAVLASVIVHQILGYLWYGVIFTNAFFAAQGKKAADANMKAPLPYVIDILGWIIVSYALALLTCRAKCTCLMRGAGLGLLLALFIVAPPLASQFAFEGRPLNLYLIEMGNVTVALILAGAIIGKWRKKEPAAPAAV